MIPVTKPYLPNREKLNAYIDGIYERRWLTNNGPLVQELTQRLEAYLGVENLLLVSNGTLALQVAYKALGISDERRDTRHEAITTPFTFIATSSSLKWEGVKPVYADIDPCTWCLAPSKIEAKITNETRAIVPVHVFGNACDVESIDAIAKRNNLKVVYDAAHAFGVKYKDKSLLRWGDAATLSFHATKLFHTIEGGAIFFKRKEDLERAKTIINFGLEGPESITEVGINSKMNEFQAAMGLCVLDEMSDNLKKRKDVVELYRKYLPQQLTFQDYSDDVLENYAYMPLVFSTKSCLINTLENLANAGIVARRYFYPSLNTVSCLGYEYEMPVSESIAARVLCLPLYVDLQEPEVQHICKVINQSISV